VQRPRVIRIAATLVAGASMFAPVPAAAQLFPGELRPSAAGLPDDAQPAQTGNPPGGLPDSPGLSGPPLYGAPPESGSGMTGFVSIGDRKLRAKVRPGYIPRGATPVAGKATLPVAPAQLGTTAQRPPSRLKRRGFLLDLPRAVELQRPLNVPPYFVIEPPIVPLRQSVIDLNPFAPTGIHAGTFFLQPAIELTGGWDSNPQHATEAKSAPEYLFSPELTVRSDWERHALNFDVHGAYLGYGATFFPNAPVWLNRPSLDSRVDARVDVDTHDHLDLEGRLLIGTDNPGSPNIQAGLVDLPVVVTGGATLGYTHVFNRFEITAKGTIDRSIWQKSFLTDGTYSSNDDRNFDQYGGSLRGSYDLIPGVKPFFEVGADTRVHDVLIDDTGAMRDSDGQTFKVGTSFLFSGKLTGEISVGRLQREYRDPTLPEVAGPMVDGALLFLPTPLTTVKFTAATTAGELIVAGASGVLRRDYILEVDHDFRRWFTGAVRFNYGVDNYFGLDRLDHRYSIGTSLTYKMTRELWLRGEFRHEWMSSNVYDVDYQSNLFLLTLRLQR
jgi:hypothetical protein